MTDYPSWGRGQSQVDYEARIDFTRLRRERVERTQRAMRQQGFDALLLFKDENVRYLSSLRAIMIQFRSTTTYGVLLFADREPTLLASGGEVSRAREAMPWLSDIVAIPIMDEPAIVDQIVAREIVPRLAGQNALRGRIGLDGVTLQQLQALQKALPQAHFAEAETLMNRVRLIKTADEVLIMHEAAAIADAVTQTAVEAVAVGARECEVAGEAMRTLFRLGGEFAHLASPFVASGERMSPPTRFATDKLIRNGDVVFIDIGACWNGYFADVGRAVFAGKPSDEQRSIWNAVYEVLQVGTELMRPGNTNEQVAQAMRAHAKKRGLADHFIHLFIGHSIGICPTETPYIGEPAAGAKEVVLEPGMTFALEPLIWVPNVRGGGGVRLENTILVGESGPIVLNRAPYDERLLA